jgi:gamma-glutamylaminecyclotransferase
MLLFVYGSLRRGFPNHYILENSVYIGEFSTTDGYIMIGTRSKVFPYIIKDSIVDDATPTQIVGELYDVEPNTINRIDELEGHPHTYNRQLITVTNNTDVFESYIYILENPIILDGIIKNIGSRFIIVSCGDWATFCNS